MDEELTSDVDEELINEMINIPIKTKHTPRSTEPELDPTDLTSIEPDMNKALNALFLAADRDEDTESILRSLHRYPTENEMNSEHYRSASPIYENG